MLSDRTDNSAIEKEKKRVEKLRLALAESVGSKQVQVGPLHKPREQVIFFNLV